MIISLLFQAFLVGALQGQPIERDLLRAAEPVSAAEPEREFVQGYDEKTQLSFAHSLPRVSADGFGPQRIDEQSLGILTTAESAIVIDQRTSKVLFDKASDEPRPIASLTKLMTALTLMDLGVDLSSTITISQDDYILGGRINVFTGEEILAQDVWLVGLIASDNVAISALVRSTGLSDAQFIQKMNELAGRMGFEHSHFVEPTGINGKNMSTAAELAQIIDAAMKYPEIADAVRRPLYQFQPINKDEPRTVYNTNALLDSYVNRQPYQILGGKTGFTYEAGYCLGVLVDGPEENDNLIVVVLGADDIDDRFQEVKGLVDWTYKHYRWN